MKTTGIIRRVDDLGRIVIPKEIRRKLRVTENTPMELFVGNNKIILKKYIPTPSVKESVDDLRKIFYEMEEFFGAETANKIEKHIKALIEILKEARAMKISNYEENGIEIDGLTKTRLKTPQLMNPEA